jgi:hypothetical protein
MYGFVLPAPRRARISRRLFTSPPLTALALFLSLASRAAREMCFYTPRELRFGYETGSNYCQCQKEIYRHCPSSTYTTLFIAVLLGRNVSRDKTNRGIMGFLWTHFSTIGFCLSFSNVLTSHLNFDIYIESKNGQNGFFLTTIHWKK